jgi:hypothetical protein
MNQGEKNYQQKIDRIKNLENEVYKNPNNRLFVYEKKSEYKTVNDMSNTNKYYHYYK